VIKVIWDRQEEMATLEHQAYLGKRENQVCCSITVTFRCFHLEIFTVDNSP